MSKSSLGSDDKENATPNIKSTYSAESAENVLGANFSYTVKGHLHKQVEDITALNNDMISPSKLLHAKKLKMTLFPYDGNN